MSISPRTFQTSRQWKASRLSGGDQVQFHNPSVVDAQEHHHGFAQIRESRPLPSLHLPKGTAGGWHTWFSSISCTEKATSWSWHRLVNSIMQIWEWVYHLSPGTIQSHGFENTQSRRPFSSLEVYMLGVWIPPRLSVWREVLEGVFAFIRTTSNGHKNNFQILLGCLYSAEFHHSCSIHIKLLGLQFVYVYAHKPHMTFDRHKNVFQHLTWFCVL